MNALVSAKVIIFRPDGKFLTLHRTETAPHHPLSWDFPGGIIDEGESIEEGASREIKEETGLEIKTLELLNLHSRIIENKKLYIPLIYTTQTESEKIVISWEHDKFQWVTKDEFLNLEAAETLKNAVRKIQN